MAGDIGAYEEARQLMVLWDFVVVMKSGKLKVLRDIENVLVFTG